MADFDINIPLCRCAGMKGKKCCNQLNFFFFFSDYVQELHKKVLELCALYETFPKAFAQVEESVPPAFSTQADQTVTKGDLVAAHKARFLKF